jgi:RimJ/RimL family protein N-acetyltransferase
MVHRGSMPGPAIRALKPADAVAYASLRRDALLGAPLSFASSSEDDRYSSAEAVVEMLRDPESAIFGAFDGGLVGGVGVYRDTHAKAAHKAHIWGMYVAPAQRGRGVAAALLAAALDHARLLPGVSWVHLGVSSTAPAARHVYEAAGFEVWGAEPEALRHQGESAVEYHMARRLGD